MTISQCRNQQHQPLLIGSASANANSFCRLGGCCLRLLSHCGGFASLACPACCGLSSGPVCCHWCIARVDVKLQRCRRSIDASSVYARALDLQFERCRSAAVEHIRSSQLLCFSWPKRADWSSYWVSCVNRPTAAQRPKNLSKC